MGGGGGGTAGGEDAGNGTFFIVFLVNATFFSRLSCQNIAIKPHLSPQPPLLNSLHSQSNSPS